MKLGEIASIRRYQDKRENAHDDEIVNGQEIWLEIKPDNFDPLTGFVMPENLDRVGLFRHPDDFALQKNDILMVFQGAPGRIGQAGLMVDALIAVPSRVLCTIRAKSCDPIGLFFWLSRREIVEDMAKLSKFNPKNGKAFLSLNSIREYETGVDLIEEVQRVGKAGRDFIEEYKDKREWLLAKIASINEMFSR